MDKYKAFSFKALDALGVFVSGSEFRYTIFRRFLYLLVTVGLFVSGFIQLSIGHQTFSKFNDILSLMWFGSMGISKYLTLLYYRRRVTDLRDIFIAGTMNADTSPADDTALTNYDRAGYRFIQVITVLIFMIGVGIFFQNMPNYIRTDELTLPIEIYYPCDLDVLGWFVLAYFHQFLAYATFILIFVAFTAQFITLTYHCCGHYHILQEYVEKVSEDEKWVEYSNIGVRERIAKIVRLHQNVLELTEDLENFTSYPNLIQFLVSAIGLCTSTYELTSGHVSVEVVVRHVLGVVGEFAELFFANYCAQMIQDKSFEVSEAICRSSLYKLQPCYQKDMKFVLTRAQKPMYITAGKFCVLSFENIINILKATSTYFAMFATLDSQSED